MSDTIHFILDDKSNRTLRDWNWDRTTSRGSAIGAAKRYAKEHGAAGAWRANDLFVLFYRDFDGKVKQKTWRHGIPLVGAKTGDAAFAAISQGRILAMYPASYHVATAAIIRLEIMARPSAVDATRGLIARALRDMRKIDRKRARRICEAMMYVNPMPFMRQFKT